MIVDIYVYKHKTIVRILSKEEVMFREYEKLKAAGVNPFDSTSRLDGIDPYNYFD